MKTENIFNVKFAKIGLNNLSEVLIEIIQKKQKIHLHTVNVDHLVLAERDKEFNKIMGQAELVIADGMPIVWYSKMINKPLPERITGVDLSYKICQMSESHEFKVYFLGAAKGVAEQAKANIFSLYKNADIVGCYSPDREELNNEVLNNNIIEDINSSGANVLLVAFGAPFQETWIRKNFSKLNTNINIGVGATLDFMSGSVKRAPLIIQKIGLEWLYRLCSNPKRMFKRYIINDSYFFIILIKDIYKRSKFSKRVSNNE